MGAALLPLTLATGIIGAGVSAVGTANAYAAQSANASYQAQVAANNQKTAQENAAMTVEAGETKVGMQGLKTRATVGRTKAGQAASGVDVNSGSFANVRKSEAELGTMDALTIRSDAAKQAWAYETQASGFGAESGLLKSESEQAAEAGPIAATGSLLSSASTIGSKYYGYLQTAPSTVLPDTSGVSNFNSGNPIY